MGNLPKQKPTRSFLLLIGRFPCGNQVAQFPELPGPTVASLRVLTHSYGHTLFTAAFSGWPWAVT